MLFAKQYGVLHTFSLLIPTTSPYHAHVRGEKAEAWRPGGPEAQRPRGLHTPLQHTT